MIIPAAGFATTLDTVPFNVISCEESYRNIPAFLVPSARVCACAGVASERDTRANAHSPANNRFIICLRLSLDPESRFSLDTCGPECVMNESNPFFSEAKEGCSGARATSWLGALPFYIHSVAMSVC